MSNEIKELFLRKEITNKNDFSTGFEQLDNCINNVQTGSIITIAGRPAMGITEFALSVTNTLLAKYKKVTYFNLDFSQYYLISKLIANKTNLSIKDIFERNFDIETIQSDLDFYEDKNLKIENDYNLTIEEFEQKLNNEKSEIVIIDYIQLMKISNPKMNIIQELKRIAVEKNIIIVVLSQVSRKVEYRTNKIPLLADLKTYPDLEEVSDIVMMIYRDTYYNIESRLPYAQIIICKNLYGECGSVNLNYKNGHFSDLEPMDF